MPNKDRRSCAVLYYIVCSYCFGLTLPQLLPCPAASALVEPEHDDQGFGRIGSCVSCCISKDACALNFHCLYSMLTTVACLAAEEGVPVGVEWQPPWVEGVLESLVARLLAMHDLQVFPPAAEVHHPTEL